jgi:hypothetical protein
VYACIIRFFFDNTCIIRWFHHARWWPPNTHTRTDYRADPHVRQRQQAESRKFCSVRHSRAISWCLHRLSPTTLSWRPMTPSGTQTHQSGWISSATCKSGLATSSTIAHSKTIDSDHARGLDTRTPWRSYNYSAGSNPRGLTATTTWTATWSTPMTPPALNLGGWASKLFGMLRKPSQSRFKQHTTTRRQAITDYCLCEVTQLHQDPIIKYRVLEF